MSKSGEYEKSRSMTAAEVARQAAKSAFPWWPNSPLSTPPPGRNYTTQTTSGGTSAHVYAN